MLDATFETVQKYIRSRERDMVQLEKLLTENPALAPDNGGGRGL